MTTPKTLYVVTHGNISTRNIIKKKPKGWRVEHAGGMNGTYVYADESPSEYGTHYSATYTTTDRDQAIQWAAEQLDARQVKVTNYQRDIYDKRGKLSELRLTR